MKTIYKTRIEGYGEARFGDKPLRIIVAIVNILEMAALVWIAVNGIG